MQEVFVVSSDINRIIAVCSTEDKARAAKEKVMTEYREQGCEERFIPDIWIYPVTVD